MKIGFIGLGRMGSGMAANLVKAGHEVSVHNRTSGKDRELVEMGARSARTVEEACRGDAVVTMLANDEAVEAVVYGGEGVLVHLAKGGTHISCSRISVALAAPLSR